MAWELHFKMQTLRPCPRPTKTECALYQNLHIIQIYIRVGEALVFSTFIWLAQNQA